MYNSSFWFFQKGSSFLFADCLIGQQCLDQLSHLGFSHSDITLAQSEHVALLLAGALPIGQIFTVGIAGFDKIAEVIGHSFR